MTRISNKPRSNRFFLRFIRKYAVSRLVFLAGSGISVPSGLPSAVSIGAALADFLAVNLNMADVLKKRMTPAGTGSGISVGLRFERLLQVVRDTADPEFAALRCLDKAKTPTALHFFLAEMMSRGVPVFTTNFDCLIERAYLKQRPEGSLHIIDREHSGIHFKHSSFASIWKQRMRPSLKRHFLFKLHGSLHQFNSSRTGQRRIGRWQTDSINGTLDNIGRDSFSARMEFHKDRVFCRELRDRLLVVVGYSGLDDFDIVPSLERAIKNRVVSGILWIFHQNSDRIAVRRWSKSGNFKLPGNLTRVISRSRIRAYVLRGKTSKAIQALFPFQLGPNVPNTVPATFNPNTLVTCSPYNRMTPSERRFAAGRLCESVGDFPHADRLYRQAIADLSSKSDRNSQRVKGLALARRGYIKWLRGDNRRALSYFKRALDFEKKARNPTGIAAITNQIGFVYMNRGQLPEALQQFQAALMLFRKLKNRSSVAKTLANAGIIYRRRGEYKQAQASFIKALKISTAIRDRDGMARYLGNLANAHYHQKRFKSALANAQKSFELAEQIGDIQTMAVQTGNIGVYLRWLRRLPEALKTHRRALKLNREIGRKEGIHDAIAEIGAVLGAQKKYTSALSHLTRGILMARKLGDIEGLAEDFDHRGDVYSLQGSADKARKDWRTSYKLFMQLSNQSKARAVNLKVMKS